ncbi:MAG: hypothetical protein L3J39_01610 [Verrucomicrobiales bacterium]|nr:hypothetical protein [Verrucomicrobiales bacterium]
MATKIKSKAPAIDFFRVSSQGLTSDFDPEEQQRVSSKVASMREGSEAIGEALEMNTVGYVVLYDDDSTLAYRYDPESDPMRPHLIGATTSQRVSMSTLLRKIVNQSIY